MLPEGNLMQKKIYVELPKAFFSMHMVNVIHGSEPNNSNSRRIGFAVRYIDSDTHHLADKKDSALHVCGKKSKYLLEESKPSGEFTPANIHNYHEGVKKAGAFGNKSY